MCIDIFHRILLLLSATCLTICAAINIIDDLDCYSDASNVVSCPCVPPPPKGVETRLCSCDHNALPLTSLERHCDSAGNHWGEPKCGCKPGYEFRDGVCEGMIHVILYMYNTVKQKLQRGNTERSSYIKSGIQKCWKIAFYICICFRH